MGIVSAGRLNSIDLGGTKLCRHSDFVKKQNMA